MRSRISKLLISIVIAVGFSSSAIAINMQSGFDSGNLPASQVTTDCSHWTKNLSCANANQQSVDDVVDQMSSGGGGSVTTVAPLYGSATVGINYDNASLIAPSSILKVNWPNMTVATATGVNWSSFYPTSNPFNYQTSTQVSSSISASLSGYATQAWVNLQGFLTSVNWALGTTANMSGINWSNFVLLNGSYANPSWITAIPYSILSGTVPTWNQNTNGTASNLSGTPAIPNGTTATTQSQADGSTKLATTAYVDTGLGGKASTSQTMYIGTTSTAINRSSATQALTGITSVDNGTTGVTVVTSPTNKGGFFGATPIVQPTGDICTAMTNLGLVSSCTESGGSGSVNWNNFPGPTTNTSVNWYDLSIYAGSITKNPSVPTLISHTTGSNLTGAGWVRVRDNYAYMTADNTSAGSFTIFDVSNKSSPVLISQISISGAEGFSIRGNIAYVSSLYNNSITAVDVTNKYAPVVLSSVTDSTYLYGAESVDQQGSLLAVSDMNGNMVTIVDVSNPYAMKIVATYTDANISGPLGAEWHGKYIFVSNYTNNKLVILNYNYTTPGLTLTSATAVGTGNFVTGFDADARYFYMGNGGDSKLYVVDISNPASPSVVANVATAYVPWVTKRYGNFVYISSRVSNAIMVFDISNPTSPISVSSLVDATYMNRVDDIFAYGNNVFLSVNGTISTGPGYMTILTVGGNYFQSLESGSIKTKDIDVTGEMKADTVSASNGIVAGSNGVLSEGSIASQTNIYAVGSSSASSYSGFYSFPSTSQLDNFTRTNSNTTLGANYTTIGDASGIISNTAYVPTISIGYSSPTWNTPFKANSIESFETISTVGTFAYICALTDQASMNGYCLEVKASGNGFFINKEASGVDAHLATFTKIISSGDSIGLSVNGTTITAYYKSGSGSWTRIGSVIDSTYSACIYSGMVNLDTTWRASSFGGGSIINPASFNNGIVLSGSGGLNISDTTAANTCTSSSATTCTATVRSGCKPVCSQTTSNSLYLTKCAVSTTTLTCTWPTTGTNTCNFICF